MLTGTEEVAEVLKAWLPYYVAVLLPLMIVVSPACPVSAAREYPAYRMTQFDLNGAAHGCRSSQINLEGRGLEEGTTQRHCVVSRLRSLSLSDVGRLKGGGAGGLVLVLPAEGEATGVEEVEMLREVEWALLEEQTSLPVYLVPWSPDLEPVLADLETWRSPSPSSSLQALLDAVSANGYQVVVNAHKPSPKTDYSITSIQGKLSGYGVEDKLPTIAIVSHYDSFGLVPEVRSNGDSNASGAVALLEIARILSDLYSGTRSHGKYNLLFLLAGGGQFNYQGSKKWLEDQLDGLEGSLLQDAVVVLCLDSLASVKDTNDLDATDLYVHVSKPPKEGSAAHRLYRELYEGSGGSVTLVHKKINLAEEWLGWEHERYSMRRLPALTLSSLSSFRHPSRRSSFHTPSSLDPPTLCRNIDTTVSAIVSLIYNGSWSRSSGFSPSPVPVDCDLVRYWLDYLSSHPRSAQIMGEKNNPLLRVLHDYLDRYLKGTKLSYNYADKRDPEFVMYDTTKAVVNLYNVKPAVFDLLISLVILSYLIVFYTLVVNFHFIYYFFSPSSSPDKKKNH